MDEKDLLKTFLRVGPMSTENPGEGQDFVIEWTPNILPVMMMGELRIKFKFGRQKYGKVERRIN